MLPRLGLKRKELEKSTDPGKLKNVSIAGTPTVQSLMLNQKGINK
jgi:hypothetical protein